MAGKLDRYTIVIDGDNQKLELAAKKTVGDLNRVGKAANDSNGNIKRLSGGFRQASTQAAAFEGPLGGISGRLGALSSLLGNVNPAMVGFGLAISGASVFMLSAIKEHDQLALRNKKQEALLKSTGYAAGFTGEQLDKMAKSVALNTLASVDGIKDTQNVLLTFKGVSKSAFEDAITLSQDMAAVMGTDSKSAALQLGKALESPTQGISALKKAGVSFSQAERDLISDMENVGRVADAQTYILETLKHQIGGAGSAEADGTVVGSVDTLSQRWQNLKTIVADGTGASVGMQSLANGMADIIDRLNHILSPDDNSRMADLWVKAVGLREEIERLQKTGESTFFSMNIDLITTAKNELAEVDQQMAEIEARKASRAEQEAMATAQADKNEKDRAAELQAQKAENDAKDLQRIHAKSAASVAALEMQFADEEEKINLNYEKNYAKIESWQVSEEELKRRGYETMAQLRDEYRALADEKFNEDFMKLEQQKQAEYDAEVQAEEKKQNKIQTIMERANSARLQANLTLENSLFSLSHKMAGKNKKLRYALLVMETAINAKRAISNGYVAGGAAAASLAGIVPHGPALAAAAEAKFIASGYANAAAIAAQGVGGAISIASSGGSSSNSSAVSSSYDSPVGSNIQSNDDVITSINSTSERRPDGGVVYNGPYIEKMEAMDAESFDEFAQRHSGAFAKATAAGYEEYGVELGA